MPKKKVLIFSIESDVHADRVVSLLPSSVDAVRLNLDDPSTWSLAYCNGDVTVKTASCTFGLLRLASARHGLELPFKTTLKRGLNRFIITKGLSHEMDINSIVRTLLQNAGQSISKIADVVQHYENEVLVQASVADNQIVHGKDLAHLIAWKFDIPQSFAENYIMLALVAEVAAIRGEPNIQRAAAWLN